MKFKLIFLSLGLLSFFNCQAPTAVQNDGKPTSPLHVNVEVPLSGQNRGLFSDASVALITVKVTDASDVVVGTGTLTKGTSNWTGTINLTATGSLTFSVRAMDGSNKPLYGGVTTETVTGSKTVTVPVMAKTLMGGSVQGVPLDLTKTVSSLAGYGFIGTDGTGLSARFNNPRCITSDGTNLFVSDTSNNTIRKVVIATGIVTTLAGNTGSYGSSDGTGSTARFYNPQGITTDGSNLYVNDTGNQTIRKIVIATGVVTTLAGSARITGSIDGTGSAARFNGPSGIINDGANLYVVDSYNYTIRQVALATGVVTTLAGTVGSSGSTDGIGSAARFYTPNGITSDGTSLFVSDSSKHTIRQVVIASGVVTTLAGTAGLSGSTNNTGSAARFYYPQGMTTDGTNLYVAEYGNSTIRKVVIATGVVTTLAGSAGITGSVDGMGSIARFRGPFDLICVGTNLFVADSGNRMIRQVVIATGVVTTTAGSVGPNGSTDGIGSTALFSNPIGITSDGTNIFVVDSSNHTIRKVEIATGAVTTLVGLGGAIGTTDGVGSVARFNIPYGITCDGTNLFVSDSSNHTIRKVVIASRVVSTIAGTAGSSGSADGTGTAAQFSYPSGISSDGAYLFVADRNNNTIRKVVIATGEVTTLAGSVGILGTADGTGTSARFYGPSDLTSDGMNLFVTDRNNHSIRKVEIASGVVTTLAGSVGVFGSADGTGSAAKFFSPQGLTSDGTNLYIADTGNRTIRKVVIASGLVSTLAGSVGLAGYVDGNWAATMFNTPQGITTDGTNLFVADTFNHSIRKIQ